MALTTIEANGVEAASAAGGRTGRAGRLRRAGGVVPRRDPGLKSWTDDYASILPLLEDWQAWLPGVLKP